MELVEAVALVSLISQRLLPTLAHAGKCAYS